MNSEEVLDDSILYELLVYSEWEQEPEFVKYIKHFDANSNKSYWNIFRYLSRKETATNAILKSLLKQLPWQFAVGESCKVIAILQESLLEIRTTRDEYSSIIGKAIIPRDGYPQWRRMVWSPDCSMLAISQSIGQVSCYDLLGSCLFTIASVHAEDPSPQDALSTLLFINTRVKNLKWAYELVLVDYHGELRSYLVSPTDGYQISHKHSLEIMSWNPATVSAVIYHPMHNLLITARPPDGNISGHLKSWGSGMGLFAWRLLNDDPYYKLAVDLDEEQAIQSAQRSLWNWVPPIRSPPQQSVIFKMQISPNGQLLVCLHTCGSISISYLPSLRLFKHWNLEEQPDYNARSIITIERNKRNVINITDYYPVDVNWWSNSAVIIARNSGAVSVCAVNNNLQNLLGESPVFLAGQPQLSALYATRGFLSLECEILITSKRITHNTQEDLLNDSDSEEPVDIEVEDEDTDDETQPTIFSRSTALLQSAMYLITDNERFQPPKRRPKLLYKTYRLLGLKNTTPEELYARKIDVEKYSEALALARTHNLDCDLVYQRQWRNNKVSIATINDYLSKVTKRSWVLKECIERVPETYAAAMELIQFGLRATNLETLLAIAQGTDGGHLILGSPVKAHYGNTWPKDEEQIRQDIKIKLLLSKVDANNITPEQKDLIKFRQTLLRYLDRLCTYELIAGGRETIESNYDCAFYDSFRTTPALASTIRFARNADIRALEHMFTYHGQNTLEHWLPILANIPESINPNSFANLLPDCRPSSSSIVPWARKSLREPDWAESSLIQQVTGSPADHDISPESFIDTVTDLTLINKYNMNTLLDGYGLFDEDPILLEFANCESLDNEIVAKWYSMRTRQIENRSCRADYALSLVQLAKKRGVEDKKINQLHDHLLTLDTLVYQVNLEEIRLTDLEKMSELEIAKLLMSRTSTEKFLDALNIFLIPYLNRCEVRRPGARKQLLRDFLVDLSSRDLLKPLALFTRDNSEIKTLITDEDEFINLVIDCFYAYPNCDQIEQTFAVLSALPEFNTESSLSELSADSPYRILENVENELFALEILEKNGLPKPLAFVRDLRQQYQAVFNLLTKLARSLIKRVPKSTEEQWNNLLGDILELQTRVFGCISLETCYEIYASALLASGSKTTIRNASAILSCSQLEPDQSSITSTTSTQVNAQYQRHRHSSTSSSTSSSRGNIRVPFDISVKLILLAADEYFDSANDVSDPNMELAKTCLHLITEPHRAIQERLDLISSLSLLSAFNITMLPLQVRMCDDRMKLIRKCTEKSPEAYQCQERLIQLADYLRVAEDDGRLRQALVLTLIAEKAFQLEDYAVCSNACRQMMERDYTQGWSIARQLGQCDAFDDIALKKQLLAFSMIHCTPDVLQELIRSSCALEAFELHQTIDTHLFRGTPMSDDDELDIYDDALTSPLYSPQKELPPPMRNLVNVVGDTTQAAIKKTTYHLLKLVGHKEFWKGTLRWMPSRQSSDWEDTWSDMEGSSSNYNNAMSSFDDPNGPPPAIFEKPSLSPFVASMYPDDWHVSRLDSSALSNVETPLGLCATLFRLSMLENRLKPDLGQDNSAVLSQIAQHILPEDNALGLALLFSLHDPTEADGCFESLPITDLGLQLAQYFFAINLFMLENKQESWTFEQVLALPIDQMLRHVPVLLENTSSEHPFAKLLIKYQTRHADYLQGYQLQSLGCGVDLQRFANDADYRRDTILGLAMTSDESRFHLAVSLGNRHGLPVGDIACAHLHSLLLNSEGLPISELTLRVTRTQLVQMLASDQDHVSTSLMNDVYPLLDGLNHLILIIFFTVINLINENFIYILTPKEHIKLIKKVKATSPDINYKKFIDQETKLVDLIEPILAKDNLGLFVKLFKSLPQHLNNFSISVLYSLWAQKEFYLFPIDDARDLNDCPLDDKEANDFLRQYGNTNKKKLISDADWIDRFHQSCNNINKMIADDFLNFIKNICFTEKSLHFISLICRKKILEEALNLCQNRSNQTEQQIKDSWCENVSTLQFWLDHLDRVDELCQLQNWQDLTPEHRNLIRKFDLARGEHGPLRQVLCQAIKSSLPLQAICDLIKFYPKPVQELHEIFIHLLTISINEIKSPQSDAYESSCELLEAILRRIQELVEDDEILIDGNQREEIWKELEPLCADNDMPPNIRLQALQLLQNCPSSDSSASPTGSEIRVASLLFHHTQAILASAWPNTKIQVQEVDVVNEDARVELFQRLVNMANEWEQIVKLKALLDHWPEMKSSKYLNTLLDPWMQLLRKILHLENPQLTKLIPVVEEIFQSTKNNISIEFLEEMILEAEQTEDFSVLLLVCLLSKKENLYQVAIEMVKRKQMDLTPLNEHIIKLFIGNGLTSRVISTPVYKQIVQLLINWPSTDDDQSNNNSKEQLPRESPMKRVLAELNGAGFRAEAGTLELLARGIPASLRVFSSALNIYKCQQK